MMPGRDLSARHFTDSAIHIINQLWPRATDRGMSTEVNEQLIMMLALWTILRWERKVGLVALERMGIELDVLAREIDQGLTRTCNEIRQASGPPKLHVLPSGQKGIVVDFNTPLEPLLATAEHEALALGHDYVGSEHLLLATIQRACPRLREVCEAHGITCDRARNAVLDLLRG